MQDLCIFFIICHNLRAFIWKKIEPKSTFVEKKWQISGLDTDGKICDRYLLWRKINFYAKQFVFVTVGVAQDFSSCGWPESDKNLDFFIVWMIVFTKLAIGIISVWKSRGETFLISSLIALASFGLASGQLDSTSFYVLSFLILHWKVQIACLAKNRWQNIQNWKK